MKIIGLTGGIAAGKSTVARYLRVLGVPVIDADLVSREVVAPGEPLLAKIAELFGAQLILPDGNLDRAALRQRIATDPEAKRALDAIMHPEIGGRIAQRIAKLRASDAPVVVVEAALMIESGSYRGYDAVIVVSCSPEIQLQRLIERDGMPESLAKSLIATQMPLAQKETFGTVVIQNNGDEDDLDEAIEAAWAQVRPAEV